MSEAKLKQGQTPGSKVTLSIEIVLPPLDLEVSTELAERFLAGDEGAREKVKVGALAEFLFEVNGHQQVDIEATLRDYECANYDGEDQSGE